METKIFDYGMNGEGVSKIDGKIVLVPNAMLDETVVFDIVLVAIFTLCIVYIVSSEYRPNIYFEF